MREPALADEELLVALANAGHEGADPLADPAALAAWWAGHDTARDTARDTRQDTRHDTAPDAARLPGGPGPVPPDDALAPLRALRHVVRAAAGRHNGADPGGPGEDEAWATLGALALRPAVLSDGRVSLAPPRAGGLAPWLAAAGTAALLRATARPGWRRLKACPGADCGWVFLDASRNTSRRWCDMAGCGNRAKTATFRARRRP